MRNETVERDVSIDADQETTSFAESNVVSQIHSPDMAFPDKRRARSWLLPTKHQAH